MMEMNGVKYFRPTRLVDESSNIDLRMSRDTHLASNMGKTTDEPS